MSHLSFGQPVLDVPRAEWVAAVTAARADGLTFFDRLTAVDDLDRFTVVLTLWSVEQRRGLRLRTTCPRAEATVPSLAGVFAGAAWHEREAAEMFGLVFAGHPDPGLLLLTPEQGHPLRKDVVLQRRLDQPWPGAKEPGESDADVAAATGRRPRRASTPFGVPGVTWPALPEEGS